LWRNGLHGSATNSFQAIRLNYMSDLTNKVAIVTGAASGIGECIVERFLGDDCIVAMLDRDSGQLQRVLEKFKTASSADRLHPFEVDVCNGSELRRITEEVASFKGGIDIVVNCAGIVRVGPFCKISESEWKEVLDINLNGVFNTCHAAIPELRTGRGGNIVNVASWFGKVGSCSPRQWRSKRLIRLQAKHELE
jgi:NAD(P)-dependent dehydrogenase (short-subunit alcohol dehydrogenase family)